MASTWAKVIKISKRVRLSLSIIIALEWRKILVEALSHAKFFSIQADGSTDSGNIEEEVFLSMLSISVYTYKILSEYRPHL